MKTCHLVLPTQWTYFSSRGSLPLVALSTKQQVIKSALHFKNYRTVDAANDVAKLVYNGLCAVAVFFFSSQYTKKWNHWWHLLVHLTVGWRNNAESFPVKESEFMLNVDQLFDKFCVDDEQRRRLEKGGLRMMDDDYSFYNYHKGPRVWKCLACRCSTEFMSCCLCDVHLPH